ncbi:hypothetical protein ACFQYP_26890 [Nonomuraea antimicrobica]
MLAVLDRWADVGEEAREELDDHDLVGDVAERELCGAISFQLSEQAPNWSLPKGTMR